MTTSSEQAPAGSHPVHAFFILWTGQALSLVGSQVVQFALIWYLTEETGSATVLALASLMGLLPTVVLGPIAGIFVDRWPRRWVMFGADTAIAGATLVLLVLFATGNVAVWHIYAILFVRALGGAFHGPAMQASTSLMVPPQHLTRIAGLNQMLNGGLNIITAPLGAILVAFLPMSQILGIDVATALFAIVPLLFIAVPQPPERAEPAGTGGPLQQVGSDLAAGFRYVWQWPGLRVIVFMAFILNFLFVPASSLLPLMVTEHFGGDALQLGWLQSAFGVGVILGGLLLSVWGGFQRRILTTLFGFIILGSSTILLGLTPATLFVMALVAFFITGIAIPIANGPVMAIMQAAVKPEMQGRVFTLLGSGATAMAPLGLLVAGPLSDLIGIRVWYIVAGVTCLFMVAFGYSNDALQGVEDPRAATEPEVEIAPLRPS